MIPHNRPTLPDGPEWQRVTSILSPGWAADGPCVGEFARRAASWLGGTGGLAVNSGTSALHLALVAVGVRPGDQVLVPAYCCAALLNAVQQAGAEPCLVDSEPGGFNLDARAARSAVTPRTRAIVVAHLFGHPADLAPLQELGVPVVEDCAQSFGTRRRSRSVGPQSLVAISSFYATKVITTGHGGLVASSDETLLERLRGLVEYDHCDDWEPRFSYRMGELPAALGIWQLDRLPDWLHRRRVLADYYDEELLRGGFRHPAGAMRRGGPGAGEGDGLEPNFFRYVLRTTDAEEVIRRLRDAGVDAKRPVYRPLHHYLGGSFPHAQAAHEQIVSIPLYPSLEDAAAERVVAALQSLPEALRA